MGNSPPFLVAVFDICLLIIVLLPIAILVPLRIFIRKLVYSYDNFFRTRFLTNLCFPLRKKLIRSSKVPDPISIQHPCLLEPGTVIANKIAQGVYTAEECLRVTLQHAYRVNDEINSVCNWRPETIIMQEAKDIDKLVKQIRTQEGEEGIQTLLRERPFLGVPCTAKECFQIKDMICQTCGIVGREDNRNPETENATVVERMQKAGCIIYANTNTSELCMWFEASNKVHGTSANPYDLTCITGASSGGEGTAIASTMTSIGIGSDVGGSIRMPCGFNGIYGHKPTGGLIPSTGQHPATPYRFLTTGPMVRYMDDLLPLFRILIGPDNADIACGKDVLDSLVPVNLPLKSNDPTSSSTFNVTVTKKSGTKNSSGKSSSSSTLSTSSSSSPVAAVPSSNSSINSWKSVTVYTVPWDELARYNHPLANSVEPSIKQAIDNAAQTLVNTYQCKGPVPLSLPEFAEGFDLWSAILTDAPNNPEFATLMGLGHQKGGEDGSIRYWLYWEIIKWYFGMSKVTLPASILGLVEHLAKTLAPKRHRLLVEKAINLKERIHTTLSSTNGVLLFPVHPTVAPMHDLPLLRVFNIPFTALFNILEVPSTVVPMGINGIMNNPDYDNGSLASKPSSWWNPFATSNHLPVCMQIIGGRGYDYLTIKVAEALTVAGKAGWILPNNLVTDNVSSKKGF